jgi:glycyl-tRNA synthetase alpha chain
MLFQLFALYEAEAGRILDKGFVQPAYDYVLKCSHAFNLLDARNAISVTERTGYIGRIRALASRCCEGYVKTRAEMGYPLMGKFPMNLMNETGGDA